MSLQENIKKKIFAPPSPKSLRGGDILAVPPELLRRGTILRRGTVPPPEIAQGGTVPYSPPVSALDYVYSFPRSCRIHAIIINHCLSPDILTKNLIPLSRYQNRSRVGPLIRENPTRSPSSRIAQCRRGCVCYDPLGDAAGYPGNCDCLITRPVSYSLSLPFPPLPFNPWFPTSGARGACTSACYGK